MYNLGNEFPGAEIEPGTNLLIAGPPMTGKFRLALRILATGSDQGEGSIVVTTKDSGTKALTRYADLVGDVDGRPIGVVDCVTKQQGMQGAGGSAQIQYTSSPVDMTGIGIQLSEFLQRFYQEREIRRNRVLLNSLSTLLMYSNLQTVFRFLHVFTGRIQSVDAFGIYTIDSTAQDKQTMSTLKQLFDAQIEIREGDDREHEYRAVGIPALPTDWQPL